jgi:prepilin-type processing-associated H-X9-DG protein
MLRRSVGLWLNFEGDSRQYALQMIHSDELRFPGRCAVMWDTSDSKWCEGYVLAGDYSAPLALMGNRIVVGGTRHGGRANVLYVDGHVAADHQELVSRRECATSITFFEDVPPGAGPGPDGGRAWYVANYPFDEPD